VQDSAASHRHIGLNRTQKSLGLSQAIGVAAEHRPRAQLRGRIPDSVLLLFRLVSFWLPTVLGALAWLRICRSKCATDAAHSPSHTEPSDLSRIVGPVNRIHRV
jgi:hypothetical protein